MATKFKRIAPPPEDRPVQPVQPVVKAKTAKTKVLSDLKRAIAETPAGVPIKVDLSSVGAPAPKVTVTTAVPNPVADGHRLPSMTKDFLLAGKAVFTVSNGKGEHFTYKVRKATSEYLGKPQTTFFLSVKAPGGEYPYRYVGILDPLTGRVKTTTKSAYMPGEKPYSVGTWACQSVIQGRTVPSNYEIAHMGKCGRCAKPLTDPLSIQLGIGPECRQILGM